MSYYFATARTILTEYQRWLVIQGRMLAGHMFMSQRTGRNLIPCGVRFMLDKYTRRVGEEDLGPHDLRHQFGYRMVEREPLQRLAQIMGHDSLEIPSSKFEVSGETFSRRSRPSPGSNWKLHHLARPLAGGGL